MQHRRSSDDPSTDRVRQVNFRSGTANNLPDSFHVIGTTKATFYGERTESNKSAPIRPKATPIPTKIYPTKEENERFLAELDKKKGKDTSKNWPPYRHSRRRRGGIRTGGEWNMRKLDYSPNGSPTQKWSSNDQAPEG